MNSKKPRAMSRVTSVGRMCLSGRIAAAGLKMANFLAKYSVPKWNSNRFVRKLCRMGYHAMGEVSLWKNKRYHEQMKLKLQPFCDAIDSYSWPYCCSGFAEWPEDDGVVAEGESAKDRGYTLVSDPAGFVIRRSPSYCAGKIREVCGKWPKKRPKGEHKRYGARDWQEFLAVNGFTKVVSGNQLQNGHHYVGILADPDEDTVACYLKDEILLDVMEYGAVFWFERAELDEDRVVCSTYLGFEYQSLYIRRAVYEQMVWVVID